MPRTSATSVQRSGTTFIARAAGDRADVDRRLLVQAPERQRGDRARRGEDRAAALLGADAGVRRGAAEVGLDAEVRRRVDDDLADRRGVVEDVAEVAAAAATASNARAPASAVSSPTVNSSSRSTGAPALRTWRASASSTATAALLSAPRTPSFSFSQKPSTSTGSTGASSGTVSRCAHSSSERRSPARRRIAGRAAARRARRPSGGVAGMRASRLPQSEPARGPASSSCAATPSARSSAITRSAHARSLPEGLSIRHSSANVPFR